MTRYKYFKENWKLIIHIMLRTYRFGVNNEWWCDFNSMFGLPLYKRFSPKQLIENYKSAKFRALACYFIDDETARVLFPKYFRGKP